MLKMHKKNRIKMDKKNHLTKESIIFAEKKEPDSNKMIGYHTFPLLYICMHVESLETSSK